MEVGRFFDLVAFERESKPSQQYIETYFTDEEIEGKLVFDGGCGSGVDGIVFAHKGARKVVGVDVSAQFISLAKQKVKKLDIQKVSFYQGDMDSFVRRSKELFDIIFCQGSLVYLKDGWGTLRVMEESLADGGILFFTVAADSLLAKMVNGFRYLGSKVPPLFWPPLALLLAGLVRMIKLPFGKAIGNRGVPACKSIAITLFYPLSFMVSKEEIKNFLKARNLTLEYLGIHRVFGQDLFYTVKARKS